jgi:hypothetical protein
MQLKRQTRTRSTGPARGRSCSAAFPWETDRLFSDAVDDRGHRTIAQVIALR